MEILRIAYGSRIRRFLPKRRASIDQTPGPSIASAAAIVANRIWDQGSPVVKKARDKSARAAKTAPAMGVQRPAQKSNPATPSVTAATKRCLEPKA